MANRPTTHPATTRARARIDYFATGGTIASLPSDKGVGASPTLTAADLAASVPGLDDIADLRVVQFLQQPSVSLLITDLLRLRDAMAAAVDDGSCGIVITQGTDTIEETAFALDLLWSDAAPVVVTGALRTAAAPGADGPANLLSAVAVAASQVTRGTGVVVVINEEIHAARFVRKEHASSPLAFRSAATGPVGWLSEGRPVLATRPAGRGFLDFTKQLGPDVAVPPVALLKVGLGDDGRLLPGLADLGYRGAVIEGFGGGHVTPRMMRPIEALVGEMPVVLASRTGVGEVLTATYRYPGSEIELLELGAIRAGALDGLKARVLLTLCLAAGHDRARILDAFARVGMSAGPFGTPRPER